MDCLDLYSGTGNITFELISRGARSVISVDKDQSCVRFINSFGAKLDIDNLTTVKCEATIFLNRTEASFDLIFADPPFHLENAPKLLSVITKNNLLKSGGVVIIEHPSKTTLEAIPGFQFSRMYGNVSFSFFSNLDSELQK